MHTLMIENCCLNRKENLLKEGKQCVVSWPNAFQFYAQGKEEKNQTWSQYDSYLLLNSKIRGSSQVEVAPHQLSATFRGKYILISAQAPYTQRKQWKIIEEMPQNFMRNLCVLDKLQYYFQMTQQTQYADYQNLISQVLLAQSVTKKMCQSHLTRVETTNIEKIVR